MARLETITPEQEQKKEEIKQFWLDFIFSCKNSIDKPQAKISIDWLYKLSKKDNPVIVYVDSPIGCQLAVAYLKEFVKQGYFNKASVGASVWASVGASVRASVRDSVGASVRDSVGDSVGASVWASVGASVGASGINYESFSGYGNIEDYGWVSFYDFFHAIGIVDHAEFKNFKSLLLTGIYDMIQLNGFCIVSNLPDKINRNVQGKLHCENGSAIHFRDGYELYFWNGTNVPKEWILNKESISNEIIIKETNAEKRRCLMEILGIEKFLSVLGVKEIDVDVDQHGNKIILYSTKNHDPILNEHIHFVKVICPSTDREYVLCVPNNITNVWSAIAFSFGKNKEEYQPIIET